MSEADAKSDGLAEVKGGKFLTFFLADEEYGVEILSVQTIIGMMDIQTITPVPQTPEYIKGVINLRGKIIPVIDLRIKFGMGTTEQTRETCIVVMDVINMANGHDMTLGIFVDKVSEVMDIDSALIEAAPEFGVSMDTRFIQGLGKVDDNVVILLDIDKVLSSSEISFIDGVSQHKKEE